jgi:alanine racemase
LDDVDLEMCSEKSIDVTVHDKSQIDQIIAKAKRAPLRVGLKLDTGMRRVGLEARAFLEADRILHARPGIRELIHMTHFSSAQDAETTDAQLARFWGCHNQASDVKVSLANSAALVGRPETRTH